MRLPLVETCAVSPCLIWRCRLFGEIFGELSRLLGAKEFCLTVCLRLELEMPRDKRV
jgi:hypothetical protein